MNALFLVTMIIEGILALGFIFVPGVMLGQFGVTLNETATVFARLFGSALLSFPILLRYGRRSDKPCLTSAEFVQRLFSHKLKMKMELKRIKIFDALPNGVN